ncbi:hypothetical protein GC722_09100 [Auraticoccus sp. F435]|uniref:Translocase n=1 Tax=Auraticoccus cholistanensis TaxID=2656650 RepID=A0A6A9V0T1_9ACTN|nr:Sec-independent protein translocase subunit TatB [Auraticoccus cholistanensis]MVA76179.1 hypothetical protein [Auraticoccus cholistanensis]
MNVNAAEIVLLIIVGILLFGPDKLPDLARKAARVVVYVRGIANNAQASIQNELGPGFEDFDIRDPKGFIRKKINEQIDPITADVKTELEATKATFADTTEDLRSVKDDLAHANADVRGSITASSDGAGSLAVPTTVAGATVLTGAGAPFDPDAT